MNIKAYWKRTNQTNWLGDIFYQCSWCGRMTASPLGHLPLPWVCPHCGAVMVDQGEVETDGTDKHN